MKERTYQLHSNSPILRWKQTDLFRRHLNNSHDHLLKASRWHREHDEENIKGREGICESNSGRTERETGEGVDKPFDHQGSYSEPAERLNSDQDREPAAVAVREALEQG